MANTKLFEPVAIGPLKLQHRVAMAPLTRYRAGRDHILLPIAAEYYTQRASEPGTLLISEATHISPRHCAGEHAAGIWTQSHIDAWKSVTDAVHAKGSFIFCQLIGPGRAGRQEGFPLYSSSPTPMEDGAEVPIEMSEEEIRECVEDFRVAARNAMDAGFDGVELHGANGYLIDQFTQDVCNVRSDRWGGSVENRSRFVCEVAEAVAGEIGSDRLGVRLSPWNTWQGMKMEVAAATEQFSDVIRRLKQLRIAYLHLVESRVINSVDCEKEEGLEFAFDIWQNQTPILVAGGFTAERALAAVDEEYKGHDTVVVFGRYFLSTPDLVYRVRHGLAPNAYDRATFYTPETREGYVDYPFSEEFLASVNVEA
ncbi:probable NADH:flavin oxidoreductase/12-oxophytodienoate reductase [Cephalotrichum gorgonifer]|uniref:Probable NADH:flavin oxidoreductase/12-oxophytodienoate reductase n=1 Tax=Cephalotrichum gorgonifer TaxID=2041049 RepID=A0AAE8N6Z8_9PEZI|nr:probable NADH:flavin oxidoreductase/12-oxophytodienoate reductase [Cephalotrichum gorgonifer]